MFRTIPAAEPTEHAVPAADLIPLSHLALDLPEPAEGWLAFLGRRVIAFVPDDLGRDCIRRSEAQRLLHEHRAGEIRKARLRELAEQEAVEADQLRRAQIWGGQPVVEGMTATEAMLSAAQAARPRRRTPLEEQLAGETLTYHAFGTADGE